MTKMKVTDFKKIDENEMNLDFFSEEQEIIFIFDLS
jgi:hypothetical protein